MAHFTTAGAEVAGRSVTPLASAARRNDLTPSAFHLEFGPPEGGAWWEPRFSTLHSDRRLRSPSAGGKTRQKTHKSAHSSARPTRRSSPRAPPPPRHGAAAASSRGGCRGAAGPRRRPANRRPVRRRGDAGGRRRDRLHGRVFRQRGLYAPPLAAPPRAPLSARPLGQARGPCSAARAR